MSSVATKPSTPRLSDLARHVVVPKGVATTAWPSVRDKCSEMGLSFRDWQHGAGQLILAKRPDGKYAATIGGTGMSIPRQVGKTFLVGAIVFALCLLHPNLTVIWTAHRARTAEETFGKMQAFAKRKRIAPFIEKIWLGSGEEEIRFTNGSRILFGARAREFGRGFDEVDVLIFDEAQILSDAVLDDMIPATNQSRQETGALLLFMGTPPRPRDPGEVFTRMRTEALSGEDDDTAWIEFGADPGFEPTALPSPLSEADWSQVAKANPSFPTDTPRESILRMRKKLGPDSYLREGLGVWDELVLTQHVVPTDVWSVLSAHDADADADLPAGPSIDRRPADGAVPSALAVDMSHDGLLAIAACWRDGDNFHGELVAVDHVTDTAGAENWLVERAGRRIPVVIDHYSPAAHMVANLKARKVKVIVTNTTTDMAKACAGWLTDVTSGRFTHAGQKQLTDALMGASKRHIGNAGGWGWDRRDATQNIAPLVSITLARFGAVISKRADRTGAAYQRR